MQYLKEMPDGTRVPVTHDEWLAYSFVDKNYQVIMHTPMILVFRVYGRQDMVNEPRLFYGGRIGRRINSINGWGGA